MRMHLEYCVQYWDWTVLPTAKKDTDLTIASSAQGHEGD